jgi:hypothetical protein
MVMAMLAWPRRSETILGVTPAASNERVTTSRVEIVRKPSGPYVTLAP